MSIEQFLIKAPAKLNLRLKVVGRRADGFHQLSMLNSTIALFDEIRFARKAAGVELKVFGASQLTNKIGETSSNLAFRAAQLYIKHFQLDNHGVEIELNKFIPIGAGLGGGSSDAAATLLALSELFRPEVGQGASAKELVNLALELGSDVPFFLKAGLAVVTGIGEEVRELNLNPLKGNPVLLICPNEHSCTASVYKDFANRVPSSDLNVDSILLEFEPTYDKIIGLIENDLAPDVLNRSKLCADLLKTMKSVEEVVAGVTGSGSALFCVPRRKSDILALKRAQEMLPPEVHSKVLKFY